MEPKECSIEGCFTKSKARGWCPKHWKRWRAHGDPEYAKFVPIRGGTDDERFWPKVQPTGFCWYWTGALGRYGHGYFNLGADSGRKGIMAHKFAYESLVGLVPEGLELDHLCRNPPCVNPDHLEPVTHAENLRRGFAPAQRINRSGRCGYGHDMTEDNTYTAPNGRKSCRVCIRRRSREYQERKRNLATLL